jgi:hypothetical protein
MGKRHATLVSVTAPLDILSHVLAALLALTVAWPSYVVACRLLPDASTAVRLAGTWLGMAGLQVALFLVTAAAGRFAPGPLLGLTVLLTLVAQWRWGGRAAGLVRQDVASAGDAWRTLGWWRVAAALAALPAAVRVARALVSPPLAWDALTYHLPRAVEWVQHGTIAPLPGPDAAVYYNHFPPYGEVYFAWALAATGTDAWLFATGAWAWAGVWLGGYTLARTLGALPGAAVASAFAGACLPAVAGLVSAHYVDNAALATLLVALTFTLRALDTWRVADALGAGLAVGLLVGTKSSAMPVAVVLGTATCLIAVRRRAPGGWRAAALAALAAGLVAAPPLVRAWIDTGNPLFPLDVSLGPFGRLAGDSQLTAMMRTGEIDWPGVARSLFGWSPWSAEYDHLGLGPAALGLLVLAALGTARAGRRGALASTLLAAVGVAVVAPTFSPGVRALWAFWTPASPRLVAAAVAIAAALAARSYGPAPLWALAVLSALQSVPRGIGPSEWRGLAAVWPLVPVVAAMALAVWKTARGGRFAPAIAALGALAVVVPAGVAPVRDRIRMDVYREAASGDAFDLHRLARAEASAWPLWEQLDRRPPTRLALAAGFTGPGHNWYRYPLYGARLQHAVLYVPVTEDGRLRSYLDADLPVAACQACWLARLEAARIEALVILPPATFEADWARALPGRFIEVPGMGTTAAFLVQPAPGR